MDALDRFNELDQQQARAEIEQEAAYTASTIANAVAALLLLDAPETSDVMSVVYKVLIARLDAPPPMDSIPW